MADVAIASQLLPLLAAKGLEASAGGGDVVDAILDAVRAHLGMDIAFASRIADGRRQFTHIRTHLPIPQRPGDSEPLEESFCQRVLDGRLPELIIDAADHREADHLPITKALPVGSHLNVPLRFSDGHLYGTFCCISREPDRSLTARDLSTLRAFAALASDQIERSLDSEDRRNDILARVTAMIEREHLTMALQPIHRLGDGRVVGVECLARFPDSALRTPDHWFGEAADVGMGIELELLAVRAALRAMDGLPAGLYASINVSPPTVLSGLLPALIGEMTPDRLVIEVTEHCAVEDYGALSSALGALRGFARIAIDDVGAGYAGLRHIVDLRPDILKLDMSLTRDIHRDEARRALSQALVLFAQEIGSTIIAEGVETAEERSQLALLGVQFGQGYLFSRPMETVAAQQFLLAQAYPGDRIASVADAVRPKRMQRAAAG